MEIRVSELYEDIAVNVMLYKKTVHETALFKLKKFVKKEEGE